MRTPCDWLFEKVDQQHVARSNKQSVKTFEIKDITLKAKFLFLKLSYKLIFMVIKSYVKEANG